MPNERIYDKINYQTNFTAPKTFAILLKVIFDKGEVNSEEARATLFPQARSKAGMRYDPTNRDTHGEISLAQYSLIEYTSEDTFKLSALGKRYLELFDDDFNEKANNEYNYVSTMLDALFSWKDHKYGRNLNVGILLCKLLLEKKLDYYITAEEWSYVAESSGIRTESEYDTLIENIKLNRDNGITFPLKKADVLLGGFTGGWKLLEKEVVNSNTIYKLRDVTMKIFVEKLRIFEQMYKSQLKKEIEYDLTTCIDENTRLHTGTNIILYGVPGAGKSYTIDNEYTNDNTKKERVVFHPDYTYSDFVGQILPKSQDGNVSYEFIPGPFTKIMRDARYNPTINYILVIEEINRGNAPAIFGDIFQLLDRRSNHDLVDGIDKYGESMYGIYNSDVAKIVYGYSSHEVKIPSNLSIICTMNTSDQNVFTLDTAFQRRWNMRLIENSFKKDTKKEKEFAEQSILDTSVTWEHFCETINDLILEKNQNMTSSEDKRLGTHFVNLEDLLFDENETKDNSSEEEKKKARLHNRKFPEKVIKYLWDDAFKFYRDEIFNKEFTSLEKVIKVFTTKTKDDRFDIFKDTIKAIIVKKSN